MHVLLINKADSSNRPPVISVVNFLLKLNIDVTLLSHTSEARALEILPGVETKSLKVRDSRFGKILSYLSFMSLIRKQIKHKSSYSHIWVIDAHSCFSVVFLRGFYRYKRIIQIQELHEKQPILLKILRKVCDNAKVVVPEVFRSYYFTEKLRLNDRPYVLPNMPNFVNEGLADGTRIKMQEVECWAKSREVIIYQGGISSVRGLDVLCNALNIVDRKIGLLLVGPQQQNNIINELKGIYNDILYIGNFPAPDYLAFMKYASLGYVVYSQNSLNNIFCAPNKFAEYTREGLPIITNLNVGLMKYFLNRPPGKMVDLNASDIARGIVEVLGNIGHYRENSLIKFSEFNNLEIVENIIHA